MSQLLAFSLAAKAESAPKIEGNMQGGNNNTGEISRDSSSNQNLTPKFGSSGL